MTALLYIVGILVVAVGIVASIALHEVGHLVPAKLFGVRVTQYMIGFGRTLFSRKRGETEYGFKLIPLGGYISMVGMFPPARRAETDRSGPPARRAETDRSGPPARRAETDRSGPPARRGETDWSGPPARRAETNKYGPSLGTRRRARLFEATVGETVENALEPQERAAEPSRARTASTGFFNTLVQDARDSSQEQIQPGEESRAFYRLAVWKRVVIMLGGPTVNLVLGILLTGIVLTGFGTLQPSTTVSTIAACVVPATAARQTCTSTDAVAPAANSGLAPGDTIVAINGHTVHSWTDVTTVIRKSAGVPLTLGVRARAAGSPTRDIRITPQKNVLEVTDASGAVVKNAAGTPETMTVGFIGVSPTEALTPQPVSAVLPAVWNNVTSVGNVILHLPQRLVGVAQAAFGSGRRDPNGPISVVGVGRVAGQIASATDVPVASKIASLIGILGSLNIALFVFNLIPLLPLDGGHVIGALWEGLRRSIARLFRRRDPGPVDTAKLMPLTFAVAILLGGMSLLLIYADIVRPVSLF